MLLEGLQWFSPIVLVYKDMFMICYVIFEKKKKKKKKNIRLCILSGMGSSGKLPGNKFHEKFLGISKL